MTTAKKASPKTNSARSFQEAYTESDNRKAYAFCSEGILCCTPSVRQHFDISHKSVAKLGEAERKVFLKGN